MSKRKYENAPWVVNARKRAKKEPVQEPAKAPAEALPFLPTELWDIVFGFAFPATESVMAILKVQQTSHQLRDLISDSPLLRSRVLATMQISEPILLSLSRPGLTSLKGMLFATYITTRISTTLSSLERVSVRPNPHQISPLYPTDHVRNSLISRGPIVAVKQGVMVIELPGLRDVNYPIWDREFGGEDFLCPFDVHNIQYVTVSWRVQDRQPQVPTFLTDQVFSATVQVKHGLGRNALCQVAKHMALAHPVGDKVYEDMQPATTLKWQWEGYSFVAGAATQTNAARKYMIGEPTYKLETQPARTWHYWEV